MSKDIKEDTAEQEHPTRRPKLKKQPDTTELLEQVEELTEALQRERADATNVRRRSEEERLSMGTFYKASVVRALLPAIDNLERAIKHRPNISKDNKDFVTLSSWTEGINKVLEHFYKSLSDLGVERIETVGKPFDPRYHEAVSMEEGSGSQEVVSEELQSGYRIGDEVIRHAMVKVMMVD